MVDICCENLPKAFYALRFNWFLFFGGVDDVIFHTRLLLYILLLLFSFSFVIFFSD